MNTAVVFATLCLVAISGIVQVHAKEAEIQGKGKVYLLGEKDHNGKNTGYYKVGKTSQDMSKRLSDLQGGNPRKIYAVSHHEVDDMDQAEKDAHHAIKGWNTKSSHGGGSEWFHVKDDDDFNKFHNAFKGAIDKHTNANHANKKAKHHLLKALIQGFLQN